MKCPKCGYQPLGKAEECPKCGIVIDKYLKLIDNGFIGATFRNQSAVREADKKAFISELFLYAKPEANPLIFSTKAIFFIVILIWSVKFILSPMESGYAMDSFWHLVNLPFHEFTLVWGAYILYKQYRSLTG